MYQNIFKMFPSNLSLKQGVGSSIGSNIFDAAVGFLHYIYGGSQTQRQNRKGWSLSSEKLEMEEDHFCEKKRQIVIMACFYD